MTAACWASWVTPRRKSGRVGRSGDGRARDCAFSIWVAAPAWPAWHFNPGFAAGRHRPVAGHDRKGAGARIYDSLAVGDLETALAEPGPFYDLILAADTLVYLGDLTPVFAGAATRLAPDGYFLFTLEKAETGKFELGPKRRWRHSEAYVRTLTDQFGLAMAGCVAAAPRSESGMPVAGLAVALFKP